MFYANRFIGDIYAQDSRNKFRKRKDSKIKKIECRYARCEPKTYANKNFTNDIIFRYSGNITFYNCRFNTITIETVCGNINFVDCIINTMILDHAKLDEIRMTSCCICNLTSIKSTINSSLISDINFGNIYGSYKINGIYISRAKYNEIMMNDSTINDTVITAFDKIGLRKIVNTFLNCNVHNTHFTGSNFRSSYFYNCKIIDNHMHDVYLDNSISYESKIEIPMRCPEEGAFIGYKVVQFDKPVRINGIANTKCIAVLEIPKDAKRISAGSDKCRCSKAKVIRFESFKGEDLGNIVCCSVYDHEYKYKLGKMLYPDSFDSNVLVECSHGIHFFMTREEAINY